MLAVAICVPIINGGVCTFYAKGVGGKTLNKAIFYVHSLDNLLYFDKGDYPEVVYWTLYIGTRNEEGVGSLLLTECNPYVFVFFTLIQSTKNNCKIN